jgi:hypothetical protein
LPIRLAVPRLLSGADDWLTHKSGRKLNIRQQDFLHREPFFGNETVVATRRLRLMNLFHLEDAAAGGVRLDRVHRLLPPGQPARTGGIQSLSILQPCDLAARDKASLDIFWRKDDSLDNLDDLPPPEVLQQEIIEHLEAALASFRDVAAGLAR